MVKRQSFVKTGESFLVFGGLIDLESVLIVVLRAFCHLKSTRKNALIRGWGLGQKLKSFVAMIAKY